MKKVRFLKTISGVEIGTIKVLQNVTANFLIANGTCELVQNVIKESPNFVKEEVKVTVKESNFDFVETCVTVKNLTKSMLTRESALKMKLSELRQLYPSITANSVKKFVDKIDFQC